MHFHAENISRPSSKYGKEAGEGRHPSHWTRWRSVFGGCKRLKRRPGGDQLRESHVKINRKLSDSRFQIKCRKRKHNMVT